MQVRTQLKYYLFSFILLFTVLGTALGETNVSKNAITTEAGNLPADTKYNNLLSDNDVISGDGSRISYKAFTSDFAISNTHVLQTGFSFVGKKVQKDKEILLLISANHSNAVKVFNGKHKIFSDQLTHVFLFLFPYHYFW